jgi:hypothetical protein
VSLALTLTQHEFAGRGACHFSLCSSASPLRAWSPLSYEMGRPEPVAYPWGGLGPKLWKPRPCGRGEARASTTTHIDDFRRGVHHTDPTADSRRSRTSCQKPAMLSSIHVPRLAS